MLLPGEACFEKYSPDSIDDLLRPATGEDSEYSESKHLTLGKRTAGSAVGVQLPHPAANLTTRYPEIPCCTAADLAPYFPYSY